MPRKKTGKDILPTREQFAAYVRVQKGGRWNMLFPEAQRAAGLDNGVYLAVIEKYDVLAEMYPDVLEKYQ